MLSVDDDFIRSVEQLTKGQSCNSYWKIYRKHVCTASNILAVCTRSNACDGGSVLTQIMGRGFSGNESTKYGLRNESNARQAYLKEKSNHHCNFVCTESGFIYHPCGYVGASPDGICFCDCHNERHIIEVKCPSSLENKEPNNHIDEIDFLMKDENDCIQIKKKTQILLSSYYNNGCYKNHKV